MRFPSKNTGVGCHFLLQGVFPTQDLNPRILHAGEFFTTEPPGNLLVEHYTALVSQVVLVAQSREGAPQASGQEGGRDGWKARAPVLCRGAEVVGVEVGAESAQYLGPGPSPLVLDFLPLPRPTSAAAARSPTPA